MSADVYEQLAPTLELLGGDFYVCNCRGCCCQILRGVNQFGIDHSRAKANYYALVDPEPCRSCGICEERCQIHACSAFDIQ